MNQANLKFSTMGNILDQISQERERTQTILTNLGLQNGVLVGEVSNLKKELAESRVAAESAKNEHFQAQVSLQATISTLSADVTEKAARLQQLEQQNTELERRAVNLERDLTLVQQEKDAAVLAAKSVDAKNRSAGNATQAGTKLDLKVSQTKGSFYLAHDRATPKRANGAELITSRNPRPSNNRSFAISTSDVHSKNTELSDLRSNALSFANKILAQKQLRVAFL